MAPDAGFSPDYSLEIGNILLGINEPDIFGSCMGDMMGECTAPCHRSGPQTGPTCPVANLHGNNPAKNKNHQCNCWQFSTATGAGFWQFGSCKAHQPLPGLFDG